MEALQSLKQKEHYRHVYFSVFTDQIFTMELYYKTKDGQPLCPIVVNIFQPCVGLARGKYNHVWPLPTQEVMPGALKVSHSFGADYDAKY